MSSSSGGLVQRAEYLHGEMQRVLDKQSPMVKAMAGEALALSHSLSLLVVDMAKKIEGDGDGD
jgi:hypothetical protein